MKVQRRQSRVAQPQISMPNSIGEVAANVTDDSIYPEAQQELLPADSSIDSQVTGQDDNGRHSVDLFTNDNANGNDHSSGNGNGNGNVSVNGGRLLPKRRRQVEPAGTSITPSSAVMDAPPVERNSRPVSRSVSATVTTAPTTTTITADVSPWKLWFTYENIFWFSILALAIATRFWDIGNRGIHHDESLHSVYSRNLYDGAGYTHDPMMHGPLQFHLIAFMYWLFGTTDATVRFASAFCGIWVVMSPFFLRRQMGRLNALICSVLLLVSPSILYFSRMAREDSIFSATEMVMIVGLWRFLSTRRPADFYILCAGLSLMYTIKETAYLTTAILIVLFVGLFALQAGYAIVGTLGAYLVGMGGLYLFMSKGMKDGSIPALPNIPDTSPNYDLISAFVRNLLVHPLVIGAVALTLMFALAVVFLFRMQGNRLAAASDGEVRIAPRRRVVASETTEGTSLPIRRMTLRRESRPLSDDAELLPSNGDMPATGYDGNGLSGHYAPTAAGLRAEHAAELVTDDAASEVWNPRRLDPRRGTLFSRYEPGSLPYIIGSLMSRPSVLLIGFTIAATIFTVLYTVFFTDIPRGIASGLFASLGYWMAQQGVARGGQPWYYYFLLIPIYEPIAVFFSLSATIFFSWRGVRWLLRRRAEAREYPEDLPHLGAFNTDRAVPFGKFSTFLPLFIIFWLFSAVAIYSWAGEKMPWLMVHMVRPALFLSSLFIGGLVVSIIKLRRERMEVAGFSPMPLLAESRSISAALPVTALPNTDRFTAAPKANGRKESIPAPPRRATATRAVAQQPVLQTQEPPWVQWNQPGSHFPAVSFLSLFILLAFAWGLKMNAQTATAAGGYNTAAAGGNYSDWGVTWAFPALMLALVVAYGVWLGPRRALRYVGLALISIMFLYQFRSAINLSYNQPDVPKEMAVYVQTSPDVTRTVSELNAYSALATGGQDVKVQYDSFASWPFEWYLRDYRNKNFIGSNNPTPGADTPVMILEYAKHNNDAALRDYVAQRYAMRWWFPEEWYKNDLMPGLDPKTAPLTSQFGSIARAVGVTVGQPEYQATLWKYLLFRDTPKPLGSEDMILFLRKDIAAQWHYIQDSPPQFNDVQSVVPDQVPQPSLLTHP